MVLRADISIMRQQTVVNCAFVQIPPADTRNLAHKYDAA